jgi:flagellar hook-associated protein 3 FlgL
LESNISTTQNEISTGDAYTTPSQDPAAAGLVDNYQQVLAQSQQFTANANSAQTDLNTEDTALTNVTSQLQSLRDLALQAESGTVSNQNLGSIATQMQQIQNSLLSLANTQDGNGNYIFAGYSSQTQPFTLTSTGASYSGDQGTRQIQVATGQTVAAGDSGDAVFNSIPTGNGTFTVTANAANTGTGLIGATTVTTPSAVTGDSYAIDFTAAGTYNVVDTTSATTLTTGATYTSGQAITVGGQQVTLSGTPATGDSFAIAPSTNQSVFTTVQNLINTLQAGVSHWQRTNRAVELHYGGHQQPGPGSESDVHRPGVGGRPPQHRHDGIVLGHQPADAADHFHQQPAGPGLPRRHHVPGVAEHNAERRHAGLHAHPGTDAVQIY